MTDWTPSTLAAINDAYDRANASNGRSRYEAYLGHNANLFRSAWSDTPSPVEDPAEFAAHAWTVATGPIMSPGFVELRPDLHNIHLRRSEADGSLFADITVPLHHDQIGGRGRFPYDWQDWQIEHDFGNVDYDNWVEPDSLKRPAVLASATVRVPGGTWTDLPTPTAYEGPALFDEARQAVSVLVTCINQDAGPIVAKLLGNG